MRTREVRLLVTAIIDLADPNLADALKVTSRHPPSVADVVAEEVVSNLESVSYVDTVTVRQLSGLKEDP